MTPRVAIFRTDHDESIERTEGGKGGTANAKKERDEWTCVAIDSSRLLAARIIEFSSREERLALAKRGPSTSCSARKAQLRAPADLGAFARSHNNNNSREDSARELNLKFKQNARTEKKREREGSQSVK